MSAGTIRRGKTAQVWRQFSALFRTRFACGLQYRSAALAGIATQFAWGLMECALYGAFYEYSTAASSVSMSLGQVRSYVWLRQAFLYLFMLWYSDSEVTDAIKTGGIAYQLCRPMGLYRLWYSRSLAARSAGAALRCLPVLALALLLPGGMGMSAPVSAPALAGFLVSMALAAFNTVAFEMLVYTASVYTVSPDGVRVVAANVLALCSGELVPIPLLPTGLRTALEYSPFGALQNAPFMIYSGVYDPRKSAVTLLLQLFWLAAMVAAGKLWLGRASRRVCVLGG